MLEDIRQALPRFSATLRRGLRSGPRDRAQVVEQYDNHRLFLEDRLYRVVARSLSTKVRRHAFWPVGHFDGVADGAVEEGQFPVDGGAGRIIEPLQAKFAESPRAAEGLAWFISERARQGGDGQRTAGWTSITESPTRQMEGKAAAHPKLASLETWVRSFYRESERQWLTRSTAQEYRFKLLVYVHHIKTAAHLSPRSRPGDRPGRRLRRMLRDFMLATCRRVASKNHDLFVRGSLARPSKALDERLSRHGWTIERLRDRDRTLLLAACVNAHKGRTTAERLARFEVTLRGSEVDRSLESYRQLIRSASDLRTAVFEDLGRQDILAFEERRRRSGRRLEVVPSAALLDPSVVGIAGEESRRLIESIRALAGSHLRELIFGRIRAGTPEREHLIDRIARDIVGTVRGSDRWWRRINQFSPTLRGLARLRRRTEARHRTPWEVSVQTGQDAASRTFVMDRFRTPGNPFVLILTNVGTFGVDLHPYSWDVVHYTPEWTPHNAEQKTGRIDRPRSRDSVAKLDIGSKSRLREIRVHHLIWPFTYDERILSRLNLRAQLAERLLGSKHQAALEKRSPVDVGRLARRFRPLDLAPRERVR
jgi:hypothetical protein